MKFIKITFVSLFLLISTQSFATYKNDANDKYYKRFQEVFEKVEKDYVKETKKQELLDAAIEGMVSSLDPNCGYFADDDLEYFITHTKGEFGGIGVEITYESGAIKIISPIDDLAAFKAGIKAGDYIVKVNNELVSNLGFNKAVMELRGKPGTQVKVTVIREGETKPLNFELTREIVKLNAVKSHMDHNIAYLRISTFSEKALAELKKAVNTLKEQNTKIDGIILDLRNNPGGLFDQGILVSDYFLKDELILSQKGRSLNSEVLFKADPKSEKAPNVPMIVLVNGGTASSSEIVASALQDNKRAIIAGTKSYGKGSAQSFFPLDARSGFKITTALFYRPNGKSIQAEGLVPDILIEPAKVEYAKKDEDLIKISESAFKNHLKSEQEELAKKEAKEEDKAKEAAKEAAKMSDTYMKDFQYARAYDLLQGIIILDKKNDPKK